MTPGSLGSPAPAEGGAERQGAQVPFPFGLAGDRGCGFHTAWRVLFYQRSVDLWPNDDRRSGIDS
jgi:hypothetical protein